MKTLSILVLVVAIAACGPTGPQLPPTLGNAILQCAIGFLNGIKGTPAQAAQKSRAIACTS